MTNETPDLTIVTTSRNDDHGGNLLQRMQLFTSGLLAQCKRHDLDAELVLVEWNPPLERPGLAEALSWPDEPGSCSVRIVQVPADLHRKFKYSDRLPLFQMIAKNVGIRRARGKFILATNIDLLFPDGLMHSLVSESLKSGRYYRTDRYDVLSDVPVDASIDAQLEFCRDNVIRICQRHGTLDLRTGDFHRIYSPLPLVRGQIHRVLALALRFLPKRLSDRQPFREHLRLHTERVRLHTNACGDFTMMSREHWFELRGYPELEMFSFHIDSLLCYMAYHAGLKEVVLDQPIFHVEHSAGWTPEIERDKSLYRRLSEAQIPRVTNQQFDAWAIQMRRDRKPIIFNDTTWGLVGESLPETVIYE